MCVCANYLTSPNKHWFLQLKILEFFKLSVLKDQIVFFFFLFKKYFGGAYAG